MLSAILLFAEENAPQGGNPASFFIMMLAIFALGYVLLILPQKRQRREHQALLSQLKKNDKVITSAGIIGTVVQIGDKEDVALKIDDNANVRLRVLKSSIMRILTAEEA